MARSVAHATAAASRCRSAKVSDDRPRRRETRAPRPSVNGTRRGASRSRRRMPGAGAVPAGASFHVADISPVGSSQLRPEVPAPASTECQHRTSSARAEPIAHIGTSECADPEGAHDAPTCSAACLPTRASGMVEGGGQPFVGRGAKREFTIRLRLVVPHRRVGAATNLSRSPIAGWRRWRRDGRGRRHRREARSGSRPGCR